MVPLAISRRFAVRPPVVRPFYDPMFQTQSMLGANRPEVQRAALVNLQCDLFSLGEYFGDPRRQRFPVCYGRKSRLLGLNQ